MGNLLGFLMLLAQPAPALADAWLERCENALQSTKAMIAAQQPLFAKGTVGVTPGDFCIWRAGSDSRPSCMSWTPTSDPKKGVQYFLRLGEREFFQAAIGRWDPHQASQGWRAYRYKHPITRDLVLYAQERTVNGLNLSIAVQSTSRPMEALFRRTFQAALDRCSTGRPGKSR
jgi:hypothetical protein